MQAQDRLRDISSKGIKQSAIFIGHGSPMSAIEFDDWNEKICSFIENAPRPKAIVIVSGHWETDDGIRITSSMMPPQIYDFEREDYPDTLFQLTYPVEGDPELAMQIGNLLSDRGMKVTLDEEAGFDHGSWVPLYIAFPNVDIPVVQISLPRNGSPKKILEMGRTLSQLRRQGVLLIGSGNIVNNKHLADLDDKYAETDDWAEEIDSWFAEQLHDLNIEDLLQYDKLAPHTDKAIANKGHILPLFFVLGALHQNDYYINLFEGFHYGNISMRSFALASND